MTPDQVAARLGISRSLVYKLCKAGLLGHHRVGVGRGLLRISEGHLADYLGRCEVVPVEPAADGQVDDAPARKSRHIPEWIPLNQRPGAAPAARRR